LRTLQVKTSGPVVYGDTLDAGLYLVAQRVGNATVSQSAFAVNLLSAAESDLRARDLPETREADASAPRPTAQEGRWALLGVVLFGMVGEWWWYHRRE
jgi:hypothetical protein